MIFDKRPIPKHLILKDNHFERKTSRLRWIWPLVLCVSAILFFAHLVNAGPLEMGSTKEGTHAGMLFLKNEYGESYQSLHLGSHVKMEISGLIASVTLTQEFKNDSDSWREGNYVFPLPENAAINHMELVINDRRIVGEIKERQEARKIYKQAKKLGKKAALTEQQRPNLFTQRVANIEPHTSISVTIKYVQTVSYSANQFELRFPMTITPRYIPGNRLPEQRYHLAATSFSEENTHQAPPTFSLDTFGWGFTTDQVSDASEITPFMFNLPPSESANRISFEITLKSGLPLASIQSSYHDIVVKKQQEQHLVRLQNQTVPMDRDFVLTWQAIASAHPQSALFIETIEEQDYAMIMLLPPQFHTASHALPRDMVFVIDTSGSMGGTSIEQAKQSLQLALAELTPHDRFNIIEFNAYHSALYASLTSATSENISQAQAWVSQLKANGGTNMLPALKTGLSQFGENETLQQLVFITDGAIGNEEALFKAIHHNLKNARLFTIGIGAAPNSFFMRKAAEFGKGSYTHIGKIEEISEKMQHLFTKLNSAVASNISINWPTQVEFYPQHIPDLYHGEPLLVAAKLDQLSGVIDVSGYNASGNWNSSLELKNKPKDKGIASLWARRKIESLNDLKITGGDPETIKEQITLLGLTHRLLTQFTSFVAVEEVISRNTNENLLASSVKNLVAKGQKPLAGTTQAQLPSTATSAEISLWIGGFIFFIYLICLRCSRDKH